MAAKRQRPDAFSIFLDEVKADWQGGGLSRVVPWLLLLACAAGYAGGRFMPTDLTGSDNWDVTTALYAGVLAFNAITLALTWSAIGKVYETLADPSFSRFLRAGDALNSYLFYISLLHVVQMIAALVSFAALVCSILPVGALAARILFGLVIASTLYALRWAAGSVTIVQDVAYHHASFSELSEQEKANLRAHLREVAK